MAELSITELSADIRAAIEELKTRPEIESVGVVTRVGDGIAWIYGLTGAGYNEMFDIDGISIIYLDTTDVLRHRLVKEIIRAYDDAKEADLS